MIRTPPPLLLVTAIIILSLFVGAASASYPACKDAGSGVCNGNGASMNGATYCCLSGGISCINNVCTCATPCQTAPSGSTSTLIPIRPSSLTPLSRMTAPSAFSAWGSLCGYCTACTYHKLNEGDQLTLTMKCPVGQRVGIVDIGISSGASQRFDMSGVPALPDLPQSVNAVQCYQLGQRPMDSSSASYTATCRVGNSGYCDMKYYASYQCFGAYEWAEAAWGQCLSSIATGCEPQQTATRFSNCTTASDDLAARIGAEDKYCAATNPLSSVRSCTSPDPVASSPTCTRQDTTTLSSSSGAHHGLMSAATSEREMPIGLPIAMCIGLFAIWKHATM